MAQLQSEIRATLIHGRTGQEVEDCWLESGTRYTFESSRETQFGRLVTIIVDGYRYETYDADGIPEVQATV